MGLADLHIHSAHSDGMATVPQLLSYVEANTSLDVIAIADHDRVAGALEAVEWCAGRPSGRLRAVVGTEISTAWGRHLLALFFREPYPTTPFPRFRTIYDTLSMIADAGGIAIVPHPLTPLVPSLGRKTLTRLMTGESFPALEALQGIEVCSSVVTGRLSEARVRRLNRTVWSLAAVGNSDAHHLEQLGTAYTVFPGHTPEDLYHAILNRTTEARWGPRGHVTIRSHLRQNWRSLVQKPIRELREAMDQQPPRRRTRRTRVLRSTDQTSLPR